MSQKNQNSQKLISLKEAISLVIGVVIGSGVFFKTTTVLKSTGSPYIAILAWIIAGVITMCSGLTIGEISSAISKPGGLYAYLKELYGEKAGFLYGWVQVIIYYPAVLAALAIIFSQQITYFVGLTVTQQKICSIALILIMLIIHSISTKVVGKLQLISTVGKLIPLVAIIIFGLISGKSGSFSSFSMNNSTVSGFGAALLGCLWAYDGWISVGNMSGEIENAEKNLPKAIIFGLSIVIVVYVLFNIAILKTMTVNDVMTSTKTASDAAVILFGKVGAAFITLGIIVSVFGALNGNMMAGSRMPLVMSQDRLLPFNEVLSKISPKFNTPINSLILVSTLSCFYALSGSFDTLTNLVVFILWIFFVMGVSGVFLLRTKFKHIKGSYKVPLYPIIPLIGVCGGLYIVVNTLMTNTQNSIIGIVITLLGLPVYFYVKGKEKKENKGDLTA